MMDAVAKKLIDHLKERVLQVRSVDTIVRHDLLFHPTTLSLFFFSHSSIVMTSPSWLDYGVVLFSLLISLGTGVYHAVMSKRLLKNGETTAKEEYLIGGRMMPPLPVALSLLTTFMSGILMIAIPAEIFYRGIHIWQNFLPCILSAILTATIFLPVFHKMKGTCLHEYFIHRYNSLLIRRIFSFLFLAYNFLYMAAVIYAPAVALAPVMEVDKNYLILIFGLSTTLYTCIGGMKAVVWTDSLQAVMMYGGIFALLYKGLSHPQVGGIVRTWEIAVESGRIGEFFRFDWRLDQHTSFWINATSSVIKFLSMLAVNQLAIQRYLSLSSLSQAQGIIYFTILPMALLCTFVAFIGLLALAFFYNCNPLETGEITNVDHVTVLFAKSVLLPVPGFFGLFVTCVMSATLSTLSSGMNSMAAAIYEDFFKQTLDGHITDSQAARLNKCLTVVAGVLSTGMAFAAEPLGGMLRMCISVIGAISGPMVAIFVLALFVPSSGFWSCIISFTVSNIIMVFICVMNYLQNPFADLFLPTNTTASGCGDLKNFTLKTYPNYDPHYGNPDSLYVARISTYAYPGLGFSIMMAIGLLINVFYKEESPKKMRYLTYYGRHDPWPQSEHELDHFLKEESP